jgi:hypothetical protein
MLPIDNLISQEEETLNTSISVTLKFYAPAK